jgi:hypothetical protein
MSRHNWFLINASSCLVVLLTFNIQLANHGTAYTWDGHPGRSGLSAALGYNHVVQPVSYSTVVRSSAQEHSIDVL